MYFNAFSLRPTAVPIDIQCAGSVAQSMRGPVAHRGHLSILFFFFTHTLSSSSNCLSPSSSFHPQSHALRCPYCARIDLKNNNT